MIRRLAGVILFMLAGIAGYGQINTVSDSTNKHEIESFLEEGELYEHSANNHRPDSTTANSKNKMAAREFWVMDSICRRVNPVGAAWACLEKGGEGSCGKYGKLTLHETQLVEIGTLFRVASLSKPFIGLAILKLVQAGKFTLYSPVSSVLPALEIENEWENENPIRIIHLLEHTSGLRDLYFREYFAQNADANLPPLEILKGKSLKATFSPGLCMRYSNMGYTVLGAIIEQHSGQRFETYLKDSILIPLGMLESTFEQNPEDITFAATGHFENPTRSIEPYHTLARPAMDLWTSARDLQQFLLFLRAGKAKNQDKSFLNDTLWHHFFYPSSRIAAQTGLKTGFACGLECRQTGGYYIFGHHGNIKGFSAAVGYIPELESGYAIATNMDNLDVDQWQRMFVGSLLPKIEGLAWTSKYNFAEKITELPDPGFYATVNARNSQFEVLEYLIGGVNISLQHNWVIADEIHGAKKEMIPMEPGILKVSGELLNNAAWGVLSDGRSWIEIENDFYIRTSQMGRLSWFYFIQFFLALQAVVLVTGLSLITHRKIIRKKGIGKMAVLVLPPIGLAMMGIPIFFYLDRFSAGNFNLATLLVFLGSMIFGVFTLVSWRVGFRRELAVGKRILAFLICFVGSIGLGFMVSFDLLPLKLF